MMALVLKKNKVPPPSQKKPLELKSLLLTVQLNIDVVLLNFPMVKTTLHLVLLSASKKTVHTHQETKSESDGEKENLVKW